MCYSSVEVIAMKRIISKCPVCHGEMRILSLQCSDCTTELKGDFELSAFERLNSEQYEFLIAFLKSRGNMKEVQNDLQMSYPTAKKKLDELLIALKLSEAPEVEPRKIEVKNMKVDYSSKKASEIIKAKLKENGGKVTVYTLQGKPCNIYAESDGNTFASDKLPFNPEYAIFDVIVDLMLQQGGSARKGNGRNLKFGDPGCEETTVVGAIAKYRGHKIGDSVLDPVFVLAAVLDWVGIAHNSRGELTLTEEYKNILE